MPKTESARIAVLGAGPIGLEAALYARSLQLPVTVYERGRVGEYMRQWGHVRMFSPFGMNTSLLGRMAIQAERPQHEVPADSAIITGREHLAAYLEPLAHASPLRSSLRTEIQVLAVGRSAFLKEDDPGDSKRARQPFRLFLRDRKDRE
jgi:2-polyprenyl-6-methoxyphenol hydroxylase-like FAD-dependent oxidoreductase